MAAWRCLRPRVCVRWKSINCPTATSCFNAFPVSPCKIAGDWISTSRRNKTVNEPLTFCASRDAIKIVPINIYIGLQMPLKVPHPSRCASSLRRDAERHLDRAVCTHPLEFLAAACDKLFDQEQSHQSATWMIPNVAKYGHCVAFELKQTWHP